MTKRLLLLLLTLLTIAPLAAAQGAVHFNTAWESVPISSSTGIVGNVLQPLPGAAVYVCQGSILPAAGTICTPTTTVYSNITLTTAITQPLSADQSGNYYFFAPASITYIISVATTGATTYSYVWTAPLVSTGNLSVGTIEASGLVTASAGVLSNFFESATANPAQSGLIRLAATDVINIRNSGNTADLSALGYDGTNIFVGGMDVSPFGVLPVTFYPTGLTLGNGYAVSISAGPAGGTAHTGGTLTLSGGAATTTGAGGSVVLTPGSSPSGANGDVVVNQGLSQSAGSGYQATRTTVGCVTAAGVGDTCTTVVTWTTAFADANYTPHCDGYLITSGVPLNGGITAKIAASVTFQTVAATAAAAQFTDIVCSAFHD